MEHNEQKGSTLRTVLYWTLAAVCAVLAVVFFNLPSLKGASAFGFAGIIGAVLLVCLYFVLKKTNYNVTGKSNNVNLAFTGMLAALVLVSFYLSVPLPIAGKAMFSFGNIFCIFAGLILGPIYGGLAAGLGGFLFDILKGWADTCVLTFVTKFVMAFICGLIAWGVHGKALNGSSQKKQLPRVIAAAVIGSLCYSILYLTHGVIEATLLGNTANALRTIMETKLVVTLVNGVLADVVAIPLFYAIHAALKRSHLAFVG